MNASIYCLFLSLLLMPTFPSGLLHAQDNTNPSTNLLQAPDDVEIASISIDVSEAVNAIVERSAGDRAALLKDLDQLIVSETNSVRKFVLLLEVVKVARKTCDLNLFVVSMERLEEGYAFHTTPLWVESIFEFSRTIREPFDQLRLLSHRAMAVRRSIEENEFSTANRLSLISMTGIPKEHKQSAIEASQSLKRLVKTRKRLHERYVSKMVAIIDHPDDASLNLECGLYEWLILNDRSSGQSHLRKSNDQRFTTILDLEEKDAKSTQEVRELAGHWWKISSELDNEYLVPAMRVATESYETIVDQVSGVDQLLAETRIKKFSDESLIRAVKVDMLRKDFPRIIQQGEYQASTQRIVLNKALGSNCLFQYHVPAYYDLEYQIQRQNGDWGLAFPFTYFQRRIVFSAAGSRGPFPGLHGGTKHFESRFGGSHGLDDKHSYNVLIRIRPNRVDSYLDGIRISTMSNPRTANVGDLTYLPAHIRESDGPALVDYWGILIIHSALLTEYW